MYQSGLSSYEVGRKCGRSYKSVTNAVLRCGGLLRDNSHCQKRWTIKEDYFEHIDTPLKAYLLGFIYADGNVYKNRFKMSLWETDKYFLELFAKEIGYDGPLYCERTKIATRQNMWSLTIYSRIFANHLRNKGVIDNKVNVLTYPEWLDDKYHRYFIHGLFDGDGCITSARNPNLSIVTNIAGAKELTRVLMDVIEQETGLKGYYLAKEGKNGGRVNYTCTKAIKFLNYLYENCTTLFLKRKFSRYKDLINEMNDRIVHKSLHTQLEVIRALKIISSHE